MWQARTGRAPTDQAIKELDAKTLKGDMGKMYTYFTGQPAPANTQAVMDNLQQFARHTGELADKSHEAYMATHLIKPTGLDDARWNPIMTTARGRSFADAAKEYDVKKPTAHGAATMRWNPTTKKLEPI
jgi:hypothetical protein